jgi:hypothetical protein
VYHILYYSPLLDLCGGRIYTTLIRDIEISISDLYSTYIHSVDVQNIRDIYTVLLYVVCFVWDGLTLWVLLLADEYVSYSAGFYNSDELVHLVVLTFITSIKDVSCRI